MALHNKKIRSRPVANVAILEMGSLQMQLVKMKSYWIRVGPNSSDRCPQGDTQTRRGRWPWKDTVGNWSDGGTKQGTPRVAGHHLKLGERRGSILPESLQSEPSLANTLTLNFQPPDL